MSVDSDGTEDAGWDVDPEDEQGVAVLSALGRQLRAWREEAGIRAAEFGTRIGYGEDLVRKVEGGKRIPRPEYLDRADSALGAGGKISAMKADMEQVRYPKKVRALARLERDAVEFSLYSNHNIHGLLRRTIGGTMVRRAQLERLLELSKLRNVAIQVMPTNCDDHAGMEGRIQVLKFADGSAVGRGEGIFNGRPVSGPQQLRILDLQYGMIRAQALSPRESRDFIVRLLGET
ncbi:Scr1 family TA system antitoxin-like transcriptional regulator [Streptomyces sp. NPDC056401]|uniref:Scr1 family TA system antitoxin-like transcriptional regulator n=1 Tax=Streptomyces sp. NPDC056401 TaxID=3345809 RepID=UPI0035E356E8